MATQDNKELQVKEKQEVSAAAEQTRPGLVFTPDVDIFEKDDELILLADMPGVASESLKIDLRDNTLTLSGSVEGEGPQPEEDLIVEYQTGHYYRQFNMSEIIDQEKIEAKLTDGVLRLTLPKVAKATPRQITVKVD
ncbi:MAG: Hsp20/alpha crystallin family protein [Desulfobacterales bacterium]